jgi:Resolvase, N terminal domain
MLSSMRRCRKTLVQRQGKHRRFIADPLTVASAVKQTISHRVATCADNRGSEGVWKFNRFAPSVSHLLRALETFNALGVAFVSLSESLDTSTPAGRMVFTVLGAVAELERSLIAERVRAGLRNARAKGKQLGGPPKTLDPTKIVALRSQGLGWRAITKQLG